jgi:hypothetical protein
MLVSTRHQVSLNTIPMDVRPFSLCTVRSFDDIGVAGIPAIIDHDNNDFVLWESAAIIQYLVDKYDLEGKISFKSGNEYYHQQQWLAFQISGQVSCHAGIDHVYELTTGPLLWPSNLVRALAP